MICGVCEDLFRRGWGAGKRSEPRVHQPSLSSLDDSIRQQCQICAAISECPSIRKKLKDVQRDNSSIIFCVRISGQLTPDPKSVYFELHFTDEYPNKDGAEPTDAVLEVVPLECKHWRFYDYGISAERLTSVSGQPKSRVRSHELTSTD
jgi:hypothetical protein